MIAENKQLSLRERWNIDKKSGVTFEISTPQCEICINFIKGNARICKEFNEKKPGYVRACEKECDKFESMDMLNLEKSDRFMNSFLGGIFGFCVGDALGVPVEFESREERKVDPVQEMRAYGTHHQFFGTWSDDTSLVLCLMDSLIRGFDINDIAQNYLKFYMNGFFTPTGTVFDIGNTTRSSIENIMLKKNPTECGGKDEEDNGNGSLMRIIPLAYYLKNSESKKRISIIEDISSITHAHKRSKLACIIYVEIAINLLKANSKNEAYENAIKYVNEFCHYNYEDEFLNYNRILNKSVCILAESDIKSSGYVVDTLEAVLWCFLLTDNFKDAILQAINLGGDTDTIAALTGGLAGILYDITSIPNNWIQCLARKKDIYELVLKFAKEYE